MFNETKIYCVFKFVKWPCILRVLFSGLVAGIYYYGTCCTRLLLYRFKLKYRLPFSTKILRSEYDFNIFFNILFPLKVHESRNYYSLFFFLFFLKIYENTNFCKFVHHDVELNRDLNDAIARFFFLFFLFVQCNIIIFVS